MSAIDARTEHAVRVFLERISRRYVVTGARLYGSRARAMHRSDSDADLAVFLRGPQGRALAVAFDMAGTAFDVMLETEILVSPLPLWQEEWEHPETYSNPALLEAIRRDGVDL